MAHIAHPAPAQRVVVYDVGGSHVSAAICSYSGYALAGITHAPLPESSDAGHFSTASFLRLLHALAQSAAKSAGTEIASLAGACLAMPGPFDYELGISLMQHKLQSLYRFDLKTALAARFHWAPGQVRFVNDAAAFTLGEAGAGAARTFSRVLGITLGTGIGAAFAVDRLIADSSPGNPEHVPPGGELWNLPYNGATVEDFVSTRFLRHHYVALSGDAEAVAAAEVAHIAELAKGPEPCPEPCPEVAHPPFDPHCIARQAFEDFGRHLGLALNQHAADFRPDVVVLGGGISRAAQLFLPATRKALTFPTELAISTLMDQAPLTGAAVHWFAQSGR